jgi:transposase
MEYFAGLDISMKETHICVVDRDGKVVYEAKAFTSPAAIAAELAKAPERNALSLRRGAWRPRFITVYRLWACPSCASRAVTPTSH